jgi:hypothetical protein
LSQLEKVVVSLTDPEEYLTVAEMAEAAGALAKRVAQEDSTPERGAA